MSKKVGFYSMTYRYVIHTSKVIGQNWKPLFCIVQPRWSQLDARPTGDQEVAGLTHSGSATFFSWRLDHEIYPTVILSILQIQEGQLSASGKSVHNTV